jgi:hypothetical protein
MNSSAWSSLLSTFAAGGPGAYWSFSALCKETVMGPK